MMMPELVSNSGDQAPRKSGFGRNQSKSKER
jgi:hypothetical protein